MFRRARRYVRKKFNVYLATMSALVITPPKTVFTGAEILAQIPGIGVQDSESRFAKSLVGVWNFRKSPADPEYGFKHEWYKRPLSETGPVISMPVPASYNDITQDSDLRDHVGLVWYDHSFYIPSHWLTSETRVWLRFDSVHYAAQIWINGKSVMYHEIGHLPFQQEITMFLHSDRTNLLTVACDNTLLRDTVPQGYVNKIQTENGNKLKQYYTFDFFNYAGIEREVWIYNTPILYIDDVIITTTIDNTTGIVDYNIMYGGYTGSEEVICSVEIEDKDHQIVGDQVGLINTIIIKNANFWWPKFMSDNPAYLYTMVIRLTTASKKTVDVYRQTFGIRTVTWDHQRLYINSAPVYFKGFGKHESLDVKGKGVDEAFITKDFNLIDWIGANAFRTSHYPYPESIYNAADKHGIMIIDECPSVDTDLYSDALLSKHLDSLTELVKRDKNHPSVIMWSLANEPRTQQTESDVYFEKVANHVKELDPTRPVTIALSRSFAEDKVGQHLDIISFNRYNAWYSNPGRLDMITDRVVAEAKAWHTKYNKPVLMSEYGADTMPGLHIYPSYIWSEEYQAELFSRHFKAFDTLREMGFFIGEFIWNFADFMTDQTYTRVGGNKKGIFTQNRQPKSGAFLVRKRYWLLATESRNVSLPNDLYLYVAPKQSKEEL